MRMRLLLVTLAVLASAGTAACTEDEPAIDTGSGARPANGAEHNDADVTFAQQMIPHHEQAVEMARLAAERTSEPRVKDLAARIEGAQAPEIETMAGWLAVWGEPVDAGGDMDHGGDGAAEMGMMSEKQMSALEAARGAEFDRRFLEGMVMHHRGAIAMAEAEISNGMYPPALELARTIKRTQEAEIAEIEVLLGELG